MNERVEETNVRTIRLYYGKVLLMRPFVRLRRNREKHIVFVVYAKMMYTLRRNMEIITGYAEERPEVWTVERENTGRKCKRDEVDMHK